MFDFTWKATLALVLECYAMTILDMNPLIHYVASIENIINSQI
jgi:hypothetical protein